jgi:hypothetical protein
MIEKNWVERVGSNRFRITAAGIAAVKAQLPDSHFDVPLPSSMPDKGEL